MGAFGPREQVYRFGVARDYGIGPQEIAATDIRGALLFYELRAGRQKRPMTLNMILKTATSKPQLERGIDA